MKRVESDLPALTRIGAGCLLGFLAGLPGCAPFDVNVGTNEPLKVDMTMEVHVYQHGEKDEADEETRATYKDVIKSLRDRSAEIQEMKDNRIVGENRMGLLEIRNLPGGDWGQRVKVAVDAENDDREFLIRHEASQKGVSEEEVRRMKWRHWQRKSFPGEWIEVQGDEPNSYQWVQKKGALGAGSDDAEESGDAEPVEDSTEEPENGDN